MKVFKENLQIFVFIFRLSFLKCAMTMNKFMADVDDLIFDGQEQSHSER